MVSLFNLVSYFISVHKYNVLGGYIRTFGPREQSAILFLSAKGGGGGEIPGPHPLWFRSIFR